MVESTLVLNASYEALKVVSWQRAVTLWFQGKAEIVETHEREIKSPSLVMKIPSVVRLLEMIKMRKRPVVQFTRVNVYNRDDWKCQYCGETFPYNKLTYDHVVPVSQGGKKSFQNIVTCCIPCNRQKDDRTPEQAGMKLLSVPRRPLVMSPTAKSHDWRTPAAWKQYCFV